MPESFAPEGYVQSFLDSLNPGETFVVSFVKQNGEPREIRGHLEPTSKPKKQAVPVYTSEGWKSFLINRVIHIGRSEGTLREAGKE